MVAVFLLVVFVTNAAADDARTQLGPVERSADAFTLHDSSNERVALASHRGRNVLVHFFATWCEPCRDELPALNRLVARADDRNVAVLAISVAEVPVRVRRFLGEMPVNFPVLLDQDRAVAKAWGVDSLPATFVLDTDLKPRLAVMREYDWDSLDIASVLEKLKGRKLMKLDRRDLLKGAATVSLATALPNVARAQSFAPKPGTWRNYQIVTRLEIAKPEGVTQAWAPLPSVNEADWFKSADSTWTTNAKTATLARDAKYNAGFVHATWDGSQSAVIEITSRISTQDRALDLSKPGQATALSDVDRKLYTGSTALIPTDGIVKQTSDKIVAGTTSDIEKARKIYDWVVENTFRNAATRGCGIGDIAAMLRSGNLGGKCADLNALYVGLARAAGLPARDVYGLRVAPSKFGYRSLGAGSANVTKAQHCRAEVYLTGLGWVPVDPADVRKVALEEPPANLTLNDPKVAAARAALFGAWEGNWLAYNFAHDIALPGAKGPALEFLMYPQAETAAGRLDCLDPDTFRYTITAQELSA